MLNLDEVLSLLTIFFGFDLIKYKKKKKKKQLCIEFERKYKNRGSLVKTSRQNPRPVRGEPGGSKLQGHRRGEERVWLKRQGHVYRPIANTPKPPG